MVAGVAGTTTGDTGAAVVVAEEEGTRGGTTARARLETPFASMQGLRSPEPEAMLSCKLGRLLLEGYTEGKQ